LTFPSYLNCRFSPGEPFCLDTLEACGVLEHEEELSELAAQASAEAALEGLLNKVVNAWQDLELVVIQHRDSSDSLVLGVLDEIQQVLDDSFIHMNSILSSRHVGPIKIRVQAWHKSLNLFASTIVSNFRYVFNLRVPAYIFLSNRIMIDDKRCPAHKNNFYWETG